MGPKSNLFKITFLISLAIHAVFFLPMPELKKQQPKEAAQLNFNYLTIKTTAPKKTARFKHKKINVKNKLVSAHKNIKGKTVQPPANTKRDFRKAVLKKKQQKNKNNEIVKLKQKKQILTKPEELKRKDLSKNKSYISYYKLINEQLRQAVIYPPHFSEGEIALSFVLGSDGNLKNVEVMQTACLADEILKETAMNIVKRASPFPPFPKNLHQKQLTFNIVFCFRESS